MVIRRFGVWHEPWLSPFKNARENKSSRDCNCRYPESHRPSRCVDKSEASEKSTDTRRPSKNCHLLGSLCLAAVVWFRCRNLLVGIIHNFVALLCAADDWEQLAATCKTLTTTASTCLRPWLLPTVLWQQPKSLPSLLHSFSVWLS